EKVVLKTEYFTKVYSGSGELLSVSPFYVDVALTAPPKNASIVDVYRLKTGATVKIYLDERGTHYVYCLEIQEQNVKFSDLMEIKKSTDLFQETGKVTN